MSEQTTDETGTDEPRAVDLRVVGGGQPTDAELAALVVALTPAAPAEDGDAARPTPAWRRAALLEGVGGRPATSPADLAWADHRP